MTFAALRAHAASAGRLTASGTALTAGSIIPEIFSGIGGHLGHASTRTSYPPKERSRQPSRKPEQRKWRKWRNSSHRSHFAEEAHRWLMPPPVMLQHFSALRPQP